MGIIIMGAIILPPILDGIIFMSAIIASLIGIIMQLDIFMSHIIIQDSMPLMAIIGIAIDIIGIILSPIIIIGII